MLVLFSSRKEVYILVARVDSAWIPTACKLRMAQIHVYISIYLLVSTMKPSSDKIGPLF